MSSHSHDAGRGHHGHSHHHGHGHSHQHQHPADDDFAIDAPLLDSPTRPKVDDGEPTTSFKTIKPFRRSSVKLFVDEMVRLTHRREASSLLLLGLVNMSVVFLLVLFCHRTNSMSLSAFTYLAVFDSFALLTCMISLWVQRQNPSPFYSFGFERFEVLAVFASTTLAQLGSLFSIKESVERLFASDHVVVHSAEMVLGGVVAFIVHLVVTYWHCASYAIFNHVIEAASSSWLQEQVADLSQSLCHVMPGLSRLLLPRLNPLILIGWAGFGFVILSDALLDLDNSHAVDAWAAIVFAVMFFGTMFPMSIYAGKVLLQTIPPHVIGQLDKCLREASTLDGVLEFRHEHFWTISFGRLAGSLHVRIRRDANEQMVLAHVHDRLRSVVADLTIHAFKDDWAARVGGAAGATTRPFGVASGLGVTTVLGPTSGYGLGAAKPFGNSPASSFPFFAASSFPSKLGAPPLSGASKDSAKFWKEMSPVNPPPPGHFQPPRPGLDPWAGNTSTPVKDAVDQGVSKAPLAPPSEISHLIGNVDAASLYQTPLSGTLRDGDSFGAISPIKGTHR